MILPAATSLAALPDLPGAGRRGWLGARRPVSPAARVRASFGPRHYDLTGLVDPSGGAGDLPTSHFLRYLEYESRRFVICDARDIVLVRDAKAVAAPGLGFIDEFNISGGAGLPRALLEADLRAVPGGFEIADASVKRLPGLSIPFCHYGQSAFAHFVLDGLLQVYIFRREIAEGARLAHWLAPLPWIAPVLDRCGVPARQRRELDGAVVLMEQAGLSSALAGQGAYFPGDWSIDFFAWLKAKFLTEPADGGAERVYLRRPNAYARRMENADALEDLVHDHGFRIVTPDDLPFADQVRLFAEAGTVMSPWGSGLTLAPLLAGPRQVIELTPSSVTDAWFKRQAAVHGLRYLPIMHPSSPEGDFEADLPLIDRVLAALPR